MVAVSLDLSSYYNILNTLKYFGGYSVEEIDNFYPFEREIILGLLNNTIKTLKEAEAESIKNLNFPRHRR